MTRFLLDQNVPLASLSLLAEAGHDVARVESGESEIQVLERARHEARILVTYDRDFGFLATRPSAHLLAGIVYFRHQPATPESTALGVLAILAMSGITLDGHITVVAPGRIRRRRLSPA